MTDLSSYFIVRRRAVSLIALFVVLSSCALAGKSYAGSAPAAGSPVFASVDMSAVIAKYSKRATADAQFQALQQQYQDVFKQLTANSMLSADDLKTLGTLLLKGDSASQDEKQQIADLETKAGTASTTLATLQQEKDANDADKTSLTQLTQQQQAGQQALQDIADQYRQDLDQQNQAMSAQIAAEIRVAVAAVAKQQGITVVFDSSVAIYAQIDLTQAVITKLGASQ